MLAEFIETLEQARADPTGKTFALAMRKLPEYEIARLQERPGAVPEDQRQRAGQLLAELAPQLAGYVVGTWRPSADPEAGLQTGGRRRSAIQAVLDGFTGTPADGLIDLEEVEDIDTELRRKMAEVKPLPPASIPAGLPASHWWWHASGGGVTKPG